ncbi:hypothetical protein Tco_0259663 [Tanacetum coccineum]
MGRGRIRIRGYLGLQTRPGLQVKQEPDGIFINQDKYVQDMLKKFYMESVRPATTPFEASKPKSKDKPDDAVNVHLYRSMIGSLMYLTASRPDIQFAVSLWYPRDSPFVLEAYSDSDYASSHGDRKSTTGRCQFLGRRLISWQCKKQTIVATSSTEAEYVAAANCCGSGYQQKDRKPSQNDKMSMEWIDKGGEGKEECAKSRAKVQKMSKSESILKNQQSNRAGADRILLDAIFNHLWAGNSPIGVDNRRITLIVIRARANSAVVVSLMEFVLVVLMEMEIKSIFQLRTLLINLQFIYPEPDYSLDFNSPQDLHNLQQQNLCCENCRGPHATIECQPMSQNSHSFGFDQLQTPQFSVNHQPPQPMSMEALQAQEDLMKSIESFLKKFNRISFGKTPKVLLQAWDNFFEVKHAQSEEVQELLSKLVQDVKIISDELSEYINTPAWNRPLVYCDNDDDEDYTIAITPESPTKEPVNSLSLGDEHLDTIPATESDEFIKSSVENLVPTPIEFEDFSDDECDLPPYDDSSKNHDFTFSNPLFDIDEDFTLSDESFSEEDIPKENFIIFSNPLFDLDEEIASTKVDRINDEVLEGIHSIPPGIDSFDAESDLVESVLNRDISIDSSPKIDSLSNEFAGELILPKSIPPEIEEVEFDPEGDILFLESLLYDNSSPRPPEALQANSNAIESLPPSHIPVTDNDSLMEEIDLFLADDGSIPPGIESDDDNSVDDDTSISLPEFESFYVDYPNSGNSTIDVVEDIPVDVPNVLPTHPILEQDFIPTSEFFAYVVWIFLPFLAYPVIPPSLLSCGDEDTIFDPGISKDCPDCEDSQFCHSSRVSHPQLQLGIRYPNLID